MKEIWKPVVGYENDFLISNKGRLKRIKTGNILKSNLVGKGYLACCVSLGDRNNKKSFKIHQLVAQVFIDNPDNKPIINHIDGNKLNNSIENLEWCTYSENTQHAYDNNLMTIYRGEDIKTSKLTEKEVLEIRDYYGRLSSRKVAKLYNVNKNAILNIWNRKSWKHI